MVKSTIQQEVFLQTGLIYFLIGPTFAIFIMRTATITQFSYFAELALDKIENVGPIRK